MADTTSLHEPLGIEGLKGVTYADIHGRYATSSYGQVHANADLRFSQTYPYDQYQALGDLGLDVHPVGHMEHTHGLAVDTIVTQNSFQHDAPQFSPEQQRNIRIAALLHDIGECPDPSIGIEVVGDVAWTLKNDAHEAKESTMRAFFYETLYDDIPDEVLASVETIIAGGIDSDSYEARAFAVIERIGYYLTAIRAGDVATTAVFRSAMNEDLSQDLRFRQLSRLAVDVTGRHRSTLEAHADDFPHAGIVLEANQTKDAIIQSMLTDIARRPL